MSLTKQLVILAGVGLLLALVLWWGLPGFSSVAPPEDGDTEGATRSESPAPVIVMPVGLDSNAATVEAVGTGDAVKSVTLFPEASGQVTEILFEAGDRVQRDDPLLRLDAEDEVLAGVLQAHPPARYPPAKSIRRAPRCPRPGSSCHRPNWHCGSVR